METGGELERTYDVDAGTPVPPLAAVPGVVSVEDAGELEHESVYVDTPRRDLTRAGVALHRRTGSDPAWHLQLPLGPQGREDITRPARQGPGSEVPAELRSLVQVHVRGRPVRPAATVRTRRVVHRLLAEDGTALAELRDDTLTAAVPQDDGSVTTSSWRAWQVARMSGPPAVLGAVDDLVVAAGARPAAASTPLARVLGARPPDRARLVEREPSKPGPAGVVVLAHLREQVDQLERTDPAVRRDRPDSVHTMRVATRRLRSALATFGSLLEPGATDDLRTELRWLAGVLGQARDAEVMRDRLATMGDRDTAGRDTDRGDGPGAHGSLSDALEARYREAHADALSALDSSRYLRLLDALDALVDAPPWTAVAGEPAGTVLPRLVRRDWRRVEKHAAAAARAATPADQDLALHELRKASKRLRYSSEALTAVFGSSARKLGTAAEKLQDVLGEHQDSVVSQQLLGELAARAGTSRTSAFILGRLQVLEQERAARSRSLYGAAWDRLADKRRRRWLRT